MKTREEEKKMENENVYDYDFDVLLVSTAQKRYRPLNSVYIFEGRNLRQTRGWWY